VTTRGGVALIGTSSRTTYAGLLQFLTTFPSADAVAQAIARGPLAQFGCQSVNIWSHSNPEELVCVGGHGVERYDFPIYDRLSLNVQSPLTESFISSATIVLPVSEVLTLYPSLRVDQDFWDEIIKTNGDGDVCQVPIFANGIPIGAYSFLCDRINHWNPQSTTVLDGLAAALGLWMSHPGSKILGVAVNEIHEGLSLTSRQIEILDLVREGKSNAYISARLGFSHSTVKQELQRVMKRLKVSDRTSAVNRAMELNLLPSPPPIQ